MSRKSGSILTTTKCDRWFKVNSTMTWEDDDTKYPDFITYSQLKEFPKDVQSCYEECDGNVSIHYSWDVGSREYPAEEEFEAYACDCCNYSDWTAKEEEVLLRNYKCDM